MGARPGAWERAEKAFRLLKELVRVDTSNPPGNESMAADVLERFLEGEGLSCARAEAEPGRANLVCRVRGGGRGGGLLLASHLDVVPADASLWSHPPFGAVEHGGYLYGRGSLDMKSMAAMSAVAGAEASRRGTGRDVVLAFVADEETGCSAGSRFLVEKHPDLVRAETMLGEGGGMPLWAAGTRFYPVGVAEKGQMLLRLKFKGKAGHGSMPDPGNAAFKAAEAIGRAAPGRFPIHVTPAARAMFEGVAEAGGALSRAAGALTSPLLARAALAVLPRELSALIRPFLSNTASPTRLKGSDSPNVIPDVVSVDLDMRILPGLSRMDALAELWRAIGSEPEHEVLSDTPGTESPSDTELYRLIGDVVGRLDPGARTVPFLVPGMSDASQFRRMGTACYGFSPLVLGPEDSGELRHRFHGVDERVSRDAFVKGYVMLEDVVLSYSA